jgi:hypothetical protein
VTEPSLLISANAAPSACFHQLKFPATIAGTGGTYLGNDNNLPPIIAGPSPATASLPSGTSQLRVRRKRIQIDIRAPIACSHPVYARRERGHSLVGGRVVSAYATLPCKGGLFTTHQGHVYFAGGIALLPCWVDDFLRREGKGRCMAGESGKEEEMELHCCYSDGDMSSGCGGFIFLERYSYGIRLLPWLL